ncbi:MAG TPA: malto-oligosyltrehalose synthase [Actinomycetota bacterium]|nr:malto-oligosyltrehalose synthase [Actinomycetota bacterium]
MSPEVRATYRVQLHKDFGFHAAAEIVPYLAELGISHLYCSPYLQARPGSTHGYDVVDQSRISDELGGPDAHRHLCETLATHGMSHVLDVVPNHMTVTDRANEWWWDVLKHGPSSHFAPYFDIDWDPPEAKLHRKILVPILGDHYGRVLRSGDIRLEREGDEYLVRYFEHVLPVAPGSVVGAETYEDTDALHLLLERQHYQLAFWRSAGRELNYRRFFSINDLAALRMDNPDVFDGVHELVLQLVREGRLEGLRIDHIDGLRDPEAYLTQLRSWCPRAYLVVEKILEPGERLRETWPVEGTTGYDFLNSVYGLLLDPAGEPALTETYESFVSASIDLHDLKRESKTLLMETELATDLERLTDLFADICQGHRDYRDYTRVDMRDALRETIAAFPVYRTYVSPASGRVTPQDTEYVGEAVDDARRVRPDLVDLLGFLQSILLLEVDGEIAAALALRFQQTTGPVMAKGVEDTVFYVYNRFAGLNEVGGDPGTFGLSVADFHEEMARAQRDWPGSMLATSTHDTKRSEDVRARLALLSEIPRQWADATRRWAETNAHHKQGDMPDRNTEYLLYQTLVGAWPLSTERAVTFTEKAAREAKVNTSWIDPRPDYEAALADFVRAILSDERFAADLEAFVAPLVTPGRINSLTQTLVKLTAPGIPDIYQGTEVWDLSLVDPDNRRPVDYQQLRNLADRTGHADVDDDGGAKLHVVKTALAVRRELPDAFGKSSTYEPLVARGSAADHVVAFARAGTVVAIAPRLPLGLGGEWGDTTIELPTGRWVERLSDTAWQGVVALRGLTERSPVALLVRA